MIDLALGLKTPFKEFRNNMNTLWRLHVCQACPILLYLP